MTDATVAVMALGAVEQHGPHLPLNTDTCIAEGLLGAALSKLDPALDVLALPTMGLGASDEHASFAGTLTLDARAFVGVLESIGASVARAGVRRLVWINGHGGNRAAMDIAALGLRRRFGMLAVKCTYPRLGVPEGFAGSNDLARGFHGGRLESALMQHLAPDRVRAKALSDFAARGIDDRRDRLVSPEGPAAYAWLAEDLNPQGVIGDAAAATAEEGALLAGFYAARIARVIEEAARVDRSSFEVAE